MRTVFPSLTTLTALLGAAAILFTISPAAFGQGKIVYVRGEVSLKNEKGKDGPLKPGVPAEISEDFKDAVITVDSGDFAIASFPAQGLFIYADSLPLKFPSVDLEERFSGSKLLVDTLRKIFRNGRKATSGDTVSWNLYLDNQLLRMPLETAKFEMRCCGDSDTVALSCLFNESVHHDWDYELIVSRDMLYKADSLFKAGNTEEGFCLPELWINSDILKEYAFIDYMLPMFWDRETLRKALRECRKSLMKSKKKPTDEAVAELFEERYRAEIDAEEVRSLLEGK